MRQDIIKATLLCLVTSSAASPLGRRSVNNNITNEFDKSPDAGFPILDAQQLADIEVRAHGTLSNATPPAEVSPDTILSLQVIAAEEQFEAAFFHQLLTNVTNQIDGYVIDDCEKKEFTISALTAIVAQEELHAENAINALKHFNQTPIEPCLYNFPVSTFDEAITVAQTFTSVVLGTLQNVILNMGKDGDAALTQGIASVIGQEGEQEGWFRILEKEIPSELPFLTNSVRDFAFNALNQTFLVPGSCPNLEESIQGLQMMEPLTVVKSFDVARPHDETVQLSFSLPSGSSPQDYVVAYINQQNVPFTLPFTVIDDNADVLLVEAPFPFRAHLLNGLTILAIVPTSAVDTLTSNQAVANATLAGPGLVIVN